MLRSSQGGTPGTDPALVATDRPLPESLYRAAVRRTVRVEEVDAILRRAGAEVRTSGSGLGRIGAAAALAWPGRECTWELIAYRPERRWGTRRVVEAESVREAERRAPELFLCTDPDSGRLLVTPHTACPVLYGLRSTDAGAALRARPTIRSEPVDRWMLFRTNQGTGDHVRAGLDDPPEPYSTGQVRGRVGAPPRPLRGGHVLLQLVRDGDARLDCVVFEPTKALVRVAGELATGDRVRLWGGVQGDPVLRVEGIELLELAPRCRPDGNPTCGRCGRRMKSAGAGRGFRCRGCGARAPPEFRGSHPVARRFGPGIYHPAASARRHLAPRGPTGPPASIGMY